MAKKEVNKTDAASDDKRGNCFCKKETIDDEIVWSCYKIVSGGAKRIGTYSTQQECKATCKC